MVINRASVRDIYGQDAEAWFYFSDGRSAIFAGEVLYAGTTIFRVGVSLINYSHVSAYHQDLRLFIVRVPELAPNQGW